MSGSDRRGETFASRWSRLKSAPAPEREAEALAVDDDEVEASAVGAEPVEDERPDEEILAELGLPDPATLGPGDDVRGFMQAAVPDRLRRIALRQLWRSNPVLANVDGLVEYGEDYTDAAMVIENMQTVYQVGKGMVSKWMEEEEHAEGGDADAETSEEPGADGGEAGGDEVAVDEASQNRETTETEEPATLATEEQATALTPEEPGGAGPTRRRMAFSFDRGGGLDDG